MNGRIMEQASYADWIHTLRVETYSPLQSLHLHDCFPMPGASGASEGTFYLAFSPLFGDYLTTAMLIWRLASYYLTIVLGYIAVVAERVTLRHAQT